MTIQAIRVLLVNCPTLSLEEPGRQQQLIVHRASDGSAVGQKTREYDYRMLLVQLPLPDLSPKDLMYYVRSQPGTLCKETSVIAIAAPSDQALIHQGLKAGMNDYMVAPVSRERLEAIFSRFGDYAERREVKLMLKAKVELPGQDKPFFAQTLNLSRRGLLVVTDRELMTGAPLDLQFTLPGDPRPVRASGAVVREAGERKLVKGRVYGVHFTHIDPDDRLRVADFSRK